MERDASESALIGRTIAGKFLIESVVGSGAMGAVYKAKQLALDKTVAVKVMHPHLQRDPQFSGRFNREARAASRLDHPNSVRVVDFGEEPDGLLYIAMEYVDGKDLLAVLREEWPLPMKRVANIVSQVLSALAMAHEMGVVHRDLKPENIVVLRGTDDEGHPTDVVKVCDFGMAKVDKRGDPTRTESARLSTRGLVLGTPEYMSPEQGRGETLDARSDIYSVGVVLYQLLAGTVPFEAESAIGVVLKHVTEAPVPPSRRAQGVDPRLEAVCLRALQKKPDHRYQTAREMRADVRAVEVGSAPSSPPMPGHGTGWANSGAPSFAQAATVAYGAPQDRATATGDHDPIVIPHRGPSVLFVAVVALLLGIGGVGVFYYWQRGGFGHETVPVASASVPASTIAPPPSSAPPPEPSASAPPLHASSHPAGPAVPPKGPASATKPPAPAPSEAVDPSKARVDVVGVRTTGLATSGELQALVGPLATPCYQEALRLPTAKGKAFTQTLRIKTDKLGKIFSSAMTAPDFASNLQTCLVEPLIGKSGGTGEGTAEVTLSFVPR